VIRTEIYACGELDETGRPKLVKTGRPDRLLN
jgi:hypothetical protein